MCPVIYTVPLHTQDNRPGHGHVDPVPAPSDGDTSSDICSHSSDSDSTKSRPHSWNRWQDKSSSNERPAPPTVAANVDTLRVRHEISTQGKTSDKHGGASGLTGHDQLKSEVVSLRKVYTFTLGAR